MQVTRAQQIVESGKEFLITYNDVPVWIQHVDEESKSARVYTAANPDKELVIPVEHLEEK